MISSVGSALVSQCGWAPPRPGWVPTRMGGPGATGDLSLGPVTQASLDASDDPATAEPGPYLYHQREAG